MRNAFEKLITLMLCMVLVIMVMMLYVFIKPTFILSNSIQKNAMDIDKTAKFVNQQANKAENDSRRLNRVEEDVERLKEAKDAH